LLRNIETVDPRPTGASVTRRPPADLFELQANIAKALGHPTRLRILDLVGHREVSYATLLRKLGITKANLSQHLTVLRTSAVLTDRREGRGVLYRLRYPEIKTVCETMRGVLATHLRAERARAGALMRRVR
jgi:ArsR family transcriptional regulator